MSVRDGEQFVLFDTDIPRALEGFVPLLNDKDPWFRSKALEAHRKWAPAQGVETLRVLAEHSWLDARRCAANLLNEFSEDTTDIALLLIEDNDLTCQRKSAEALLNGRDAALHIERFLNHDDSALRRLSVFLMLQRLNIVLLHLKMSTTVYEKQHCNQS